MNIFKTSERNEWRDYLSAHFESLSEVWFVFPTKDSGEAGLSYNDAVEEALCFGWIDSTQKVIGGVRMQRFTPRRKGSLWTERNKERVRRLERLGRMTDAGRAVLPPMGQRSFRIDPDVEAALKKARVWSRFKAFPPLYQRIRAYNTAFYKRRDAAAYEKALSHLIEATRQGKMYGEWNDYGRLLEFEDTGDR